MNTLSKELTAQILGGQAAWLKLRKKWAEILSSDRRNDLTAAHHLLANAALGRDWRKGFTSISEETRKGKNKLKSWISPDQALFDALWDLRSANLDPHKILDPFEGGNFGQGIRGIEVYFALRGFNLRSLHQGRLPALPSGH